MNSECLLIWNVHGLNGWARRAMVDDLVAQGCLSLLCIQENKLCVRDQTLVSNILGSRFDYVVVSATSTRGGILMGSHTNKWC
jgi:exonuclease III